MARVLISGAKSSVSFFILDMLKPSVKGLLWGEGLGLSTRWHKGGCPQLGALIVHLCSGLRGVWYTVELCSKLVVSLEDHVVTGAGGTRTEFPRWLSKREPPEHLGHHIWVQAEEATTSVTLEARSVPVKFWKMHISTLKFYIQINYPLSLRAKQRHCHTCFFPQMYPICTLLKEFT